MYLKAFGDNIAISIYQKALDLDKKLWGILRIPIIVSFFNLVCIIKYSVCYILGVADSSCPDVQMGFCMESTGMTHGGQDETFSEQQMVGGSWEESECKDETESMEDGQDPEV